jgi:hypothetical protein
MRVGAAVPPAAFSGMSLNNSAMSLFEHPGWFSGRAEGVVQSASALIADDVIGERT